MNTGFILAIIALLCLVQVVRSLLALRARYRPLPAASRPGSYRALTFVYASMLALLAALLVYGLVLAFDRT